MSELDSKSLVAFGETLWDCLPHGLFLGGAPLNVAYHAARLGAASYMASSVGRDFLGDQAFERASKSGVDTFLLKRHDYLTTGVAIASLDESGNASYDIRRPVAWDDIRLDKADIERCGEMGVLVYGTLAARSESNRKTLGELLASEVGIKICDVNLRKPYDSPQVALELASQADVLKINEDELEVLAGKSDIGFERSLELCGEKTGVSIICVTLGGKGAVLWESGKLVRCEGKPVEVADTIGAGDSFTAAFAVSMMEGRSLPECLSRAVQLGSFVAGKSGAQPDYAPEQVFG